MNRLAVPAAVAVTLVAGAAVAAPAHDLSGYLSPSGLAFLSEQLPGYLPSHMSPPTMTMDLVDCPGSRVVTFTQRDSEIDLQVNEATMSVPQPGRVRIALTFDVFADGEAYIEYPYACFGSATCNDDLTVLGGRAVVDFTAAVDATGTPRVTVSNIDLLIGEDDIAFELADCAIDSVVNWVIDKGKGWLLDMVVGKLESLAQDSMVPWLEGMLGGLLQTHGTLAIADFDFTMTDVSPSAGALRFAGEADLSSPYPIAACVGADPGEPTPLPGAGPDPASGAPADLGLAVNLGLVDDLLYQVWREGMTCLTADHLKALGVDFDIEATASLLPGVPVGSTIDLELRLASPPRVEGRDDGGATLTLVLEGIEIALIARAPGGQVTELDVQADASATATFALDPARNALTLEIDAVQITRLVANEDYVKATGLDLAQLQAVAEATLIPTMLDELRGKPLTGPIFGFADYYLILRDLRTTASHVLVKADLFRAPADDRDAPQTQIVSAPAQVVRPAKSLVTVRGEDAEVPPELLRYRFAIDGVAADPSYVTSAQIGQPGRTATYRVAVTAIDLAGNEDPTPATVEVTVDGVPPRLRMLSDRTVQLPQTATSVDLSWAATDDRTPAEQLVSSLTLERILDPQDAADVERVGQVELAAGVAEGSVAVEAGERYRVVVAVRDEAGNVSHASVIVHVAGEPAGCGCQDSGGSSGAGGPVLVALVGLWLRRRRPALGTRSAR